MNNDENNDKLKIREHQKEGIIINGGLVAMCVYVVIQLIEQPSLDIALWISLCCCAFAIPFLSLNYLNSELGNMFNFTLSKSKLGEHPLATEITIFFFAQYWSRIIAVFGIWTLFLHFSWIVGLLFLIAGLIAFYVQKKIIPRFHQFISQNSPKRE